MSRDTAAQKTARSGLEDLRLFRWAAVLLFGLFAIGCGGETQDDATKVPMDAELPFGVDESLSTELLGVEDRDANRKQAAAARDLCSSWLDDATKCDDLNPRQGPPAIDIVYPVDGATVPQSFEMEVAVENFKLQPAGRSLAGQGHWHVIIDQECAEPGELIPTGGNHFHAGDGSNKRTIQLSPGPHELCIQIGDGFHVAVAISKTINVFVQ